MTRTKSKYFPRQEECEGLATITTHHPEGVTVWHKRDPKRGRWYPDADKSYLSTGQLLGMFLTNPSNVTYSTEEASP